MTTKLLGIAALAAAVAIPAASFAQTFAYVNTSGDVSSVEATDAATALRTASNISAHSGVLMLQNDNDSILDDSVSMSSMGGSSMTTGSSNTSGNSSNSGSMNNSGSATGSNSNSSSMNGSNTTSGTNNSNGTMNSGT